MDKILLGRTYETTIFFHDEDSAIIWIEQDLEKRDIWVASISNIVKCKFKEEKKELVPCDD